MITGTVNASLQPLIRLPIRSTDGLHQEIEALVDTGFNGSLTLPPNIIAALALPWRTRALVTLANGLEDECDVHTATIVWDGGVRNILVEAANTDPLVGMALLRGYELRMQVIAGGTVVIEAPS